MAFRLSPIFNDAQLSDAGTPLTGGLLYWYVAGTMTPATVYRTNHGVAHPHPVTLNARGEPPAPIWLTEGIAYKAILKTPDGVTIRVVDDITGVGDVSAAPSTFDAVVVDSTGNGGTVYQSESGHITLGSNNRTGTKATLDVGGGRSKSSVPIIAPKARFGDSALPSESLEAAGNAVVDGDLTVGNAAGGVGPIRRALSADRTYYVRDNGSDDNDGLANTELRAFLTLQRAIDELKTLDLQDSSVVISLQNGTYTGALVLPPVIGVGTVTIQGNVITPESVVLNGANGGYAINSTGPGRWTFSGLRLTNTLGGGIRVAHGMVASFASVQFGACLYDQMFVDTLGYASLAGGLIKVVAGAQSWVHAENGGFFSARGQTVTIENTPAYTWAFAATRRNSTIDLSGATFVGTATGSSYHSSQKAVLITPAGGVSDIPGDGTGTAADSGSVTGGDAQAQSDILDALAGAVLTSANKLMALRNVGSTPTLTEWATGTVTPSLLACDDAAALRTLLALRPGVDVQAYDADLAAIADLATTSYGRGLLTMASAAALKTALSLVIGTDVQAYSSRLTTFAALLLSQSTAGPIDVETGLPTPLPGLLRYNEAGQVEVDLTSYVTPDALSSLATTSALDAAIAALAAETASTYLPASAVSRYLTADDEPSIRSEIIGTDFIGDTAASPFTTGSINGGTLIGGSSVAAEPGHSGIVEAITNATATADSGYRIYTGRVALYLSGRQWYEARFKLLTVSNTYHRLGFFDSQTPSVAIANGLYVTITNATLKAISMVSSVSTETTYGTSLAINTWYRVDIQFVASGTVAEIRLYNDDSGALLYESIITTNLPLGAACGAGFVFTSSAAASSVSLARCDSQYVRFR